VALGVERRAAAPLLLSAGTCCTVHMLQACRHSPGSTPAATACSGRMM